MSATTRRARRRLPRRVAGGALAAVAVLALAACSGSTPDAGPSAGPGTGAGTTASGSSAGSVPTGGSLPTAGPGTTGGAAVNTGGPPVPSAGCATKATHPTGPTPATITVDGRERKYQVYLDPAYATANEPVPVVFTFHGRNSNSSQQLAYSAFGPYAAETGAVVVAPDALDEMRQWSPFGMFQGVDDTPFFGALLEQIGSDYCVDTSRVHLAGMSSGGLMVSALACKYRDQIASVAAVTFTVLFPQQCPGTEPVPFLYFHGTEDPVIRFEGNGPDAEGNASPGSAPSKAQDWAEHNGCDPQPTDTRIGADVIHRSWNGCEAPTDFYIVEGGGHTWPGGIEVARLGPTTQTIDATELIVERFADSRVP